MTIESKKDAGKLTLTITGRLNTSTAPNLEETLKGSYGGVTELVFDLAKVVDHADQTEDDRHADDKQPPAAVLSAEKDHAQQKRGGDRPDEQNAAHRRDILLLHVPGRAVLEDLLPEFELAQEPDHRRAQRRRNGESRGECNDHFCHTVLSFPVFEEARKHALDVRAVAALK